MGNFRDAVEEQRSDDNNTGLFAKRCKANGPLRIRGGNKPGKHRSGGQTSIRLICKAAQRGGCIKGKEPLKEPRVVIESAGRESERKRIPGHVLRREAAATRAYGSGILKLPEREKGFGGWATLQAFGGQKEEGVCPGGDKP